MTENEEASEDWTAWKIWCHPRKALDVIDESALMIMKLEKKGEEADLTLAERACLYDRLSEECDSLKSALGERDKMIEQLRADLDAARGSLREAREELALQKSVDDKLAEFDARLSEAEIVKRRYEKRITELEGMLRIHSSGGGFPDDDELAIDSVDAESAETFTIDMTRHEENTRSFVKETGIRGEKKENVENHATELQRRFREKPAPGLPEKVTPEEGTATDKWLFDLPEDL